MYYNEHKKTCEGENRVMEFMNTEILQSFFAASDHFMVFASGAGVIALVFIAVRCFKKGKENKVHTKSEKSL